MSIAAQVVYKDPSINCTRISTHATDRDRDSDRDRVILQRIFDYNKRRIILQ
jgi:hypothetical protein